MTCDEIEKRLPAYREDLLSQEERKIITGHLTSCLHCNRSFAGLEKTEQLIRCLGAVEPPPFFEQRIMAQVREEAGKKQGILRTLFYPLHIKVPIQALATLLVAVFTIYVYQSGEPEMKAMAPLPLPLTDLGKDHVTAEPPKTLTSPSAAAKTERVPAERRDLPEKNQQRFVAPPPEKDGKAEKASDSRAAIQEERSSAVKSADPLMVAKEKEPPPARVEVLNRMWDKPGKQDADKTFETPPREQKSKERVSDTGAGVRESAKTTSAPSPSRMTAAATIKKRPVIDLTIRVSDTDVAIREIEARLGRVNARIIERQDNEGSKFLKAEVAEQKVAAMLDLLEAIGRVNLETRPLVVPGEDVTMSINIVAHP